jgi:transposase-like protein
MAKRIYDERDRAAVYVALQANDGIASRAARDTGVPPNTVRDWKRQFEKDGPPDTTYVEDIRTDFLDDAQRVRDKLIKKYEEALDRGEVKADKMPVHIGILTDKVQLLKGMATHRTEAVKLPSADQMRELAGGVFTAMLEAVSRQDERSQDIIEADYVEVENNPRKELSAPTKE